MIKILVAFSIFISIGIIFSSYAEEDCGLGEELIDGECQIIDYRVYHAYRITHIENFPDPEKSPLYYIDRYNTEPEYKSWFDSLFPDKSIEEIVSYRETHVEGFPDNSKSPKYYVERLHFEEGYEPWFDEQFPSLQIYNIVGIDEKQYLEIVNSIEESKMSEAEKQAREEIPNPCTDIKEPQIDPKMQGDIGLNDPAYMEAFREAQYQYQQQIQQCLSNYEIQIAEATEKSSEVQNGIHTTITVTGTATATASVKVNLDEILKDAEHKPSLEVVIDEFVAGEMGIYWELAEFPEYYNLVRIKCGFILWDLHGKFLNLTKTNQANTLSEFVYCSESEIRKEVQEGEIIQTVKEQGETGLQWQFILFLIGIPIMVIVGFIWYKKSRKKLVPENS